ncbi:HEAT repeat domain-containing protein [Gynuella sunshinyii]|uniref:HEAT repeat domain-containing protein n=1 Tax=Gynuella sunshinyii TaxID=1445505 RepID=UPI00118628BE|nr:hypothetical protein [Gynuella sunshinyii]
MKNSELDRKNILKTFGYNPLDAFKAGYSHLVPKGRSRLEDILKILSEYGVENLRLLLNSSDENTAINALYVFSELGRNGCPLIDDVMACFKYSDPSARWYILDGLISHISDLSLEYIATCIETASDQSSRVRGKAIEFIGTTNS